MNVRLEMYRRFEWRSTRWDKWVWECGSNCDGCVGGWRSWEQSV